MRQFTVYWPIAVELHRPATHKEDSVRCLGMCEWLVVLLRMKDLTHPYLTKRHSFVIKTKFQHRKKFFMICSELKGSETDFSTKW